MSKTNTPVDLNTKFYLMGTTAGLEAWRIEINVTDPPWGSLPGIKTHFCRYQPKLEKLFVSVPGIKNLPGFETDPPKKIRAWAVDLRAAWKGPSL